VFFILSSANQQKLEAVYIQLEYPVLYTHSLGQTALTLLIFTKEDSFKKILSKEIFDNYTEYMTDSLLMSSY
jgi:hypothetical protein